MYVADMFAQIPDGLQSEYRKRAIAGTLSYMAPSLSATPVAHDSSPRSDTTEVSWNDYLKALGLLTSAEELQMDIDICQYDLRHVSLSFSLAYTPESTDVSAVFRVHGSCENRPRVLIGDIIR